MNSGKLLDQCALLLSRMFHPFIISVPAGILFLYLAEISFLESLKWVFLSASLTIIPTLLFMNFHPNYHLRDISSRENRNLLYFLALIELGILTALISILEAPEIITTVSYSAILLVLVGSIINRFTKISLHVGVLSGFSTAISFLSVDIGILCFILTLGVLWSRLRLGRHTLQQVALGLAIPVSCITLIFQALI